MSKNTASGTADIGSGTQDVGTASGTAEVKPKPKPKDDDPMSDENLDNMSNTGSTWYQYKNKKR